MEVIIFSHGFVHKNKLLLPPLPLENPHLQEMAHILYLRKQE